MLNHIHLIARSSDMIGFIRDFKTFTSKEIKRNILETEPHILKLFEESETGNKSEGHARHADTQGLRTKIFAEVCFAKQDQT